MSKGDYIPENEIRKRAIFGFRWALIGKIVVTTYSWVATLLMVRLLTPSDYGLQAMWEGPLELAALIGVWCVDQALIRHRIQDKETLSEVFGVLLLSSGLSAVSVYLSAPYIAQYFQSPKLEPILQVLTISLLLAPLRIIPNALLDLEMQFKKRAQVDMFSGLLAATTGLILAYLKFGVWALVISILVDAFFRIIVLAFILPWMVTPKLSLKRSKLMLREASQMLFGAIVALVGAKAVNVIAGPVAGPELLGNLAVAITLAFLPLVKLMPIVNQVLYSTHSNLRDLNDTRKYHLNAIEFGLLFCAPISIGMSLVSNNLVSTIFGEHWNLAADALAVIALLIPLRLVCQLTSSMLIAKGKVKDVNIINISVTLLTIVLAFITPAYGLWGMLIIGILSTLLNVSGTLFQLHSFLEMSPLLILGKIRKVILLNFLLVISCQLSEKVFAVEKVTPFNALVLTVSVGILTYSVGFAVLYRNQLGDIFRVIYSRKVAD